MASKVNFSLKRFLILLAIVPLGMGVIFLSDHFQTGIDWKMVANTVLIAGLLMTGIAKFLVYRNSKKQNPPA